MTKAVGKVFGGGGAAPAPQVVPVAPTEDPEAATKRDAESRQAQLDRENTGRRATIVAGQSIAEEEQQSRGLFKAKSRKAAASAILG